MLRTRFAKDIVAEFLPSNAWMAPKEWGKPYKRKSGKVRAEKIAILCDGMPSVPKRHELMEFLSKKGFFVIHPRYRGSWESGGVFLEKSPHLDILDVVNELQTGKIRDVTYGQVFEFSVKQIVVIGGSFGGPAAILSTLDKWVDKAVAVCPVVDWSILSQAEKVETSNPSYVSYIQQAFGNGYRLTQKNWDRLKTGMFYSPLFHVKELDAKKFILFHAKDDPIVSAKTVVDFAKKTGTHLTLQKRGGHISTKDTVPKYWKQISAFFKS